MIPASYLFKQMYHREFEQDPAELLAEIESRRGLPAPSPFDRFTAALIGAAFGSASYVLGAASPTGRRR